MRNFVFLIACATVGCSQTVPSGSGSSANTSTHGEVGPQVTVVQGSVPTDEQQAKLLAAKEALFEKLSGRLMQAMGEGGPAAAILVWKKKPQKLLSPSVSSKVFRSDAPEFGCETRAINRPAGRLSLSRRKPTSRRSSTCPTTRPQPFCRSICRCNA